VKYLLAALASYALGWTGGYALIMGTVFRYFVEYLQLAWTGGGEIPGFIQLVAVGGSVAAPACVWLVGRMRRAGGPAGDARASVPPRHRQVGALRRTVATLVLVVLSEFAWPSGTDSPWSYGWRLLLSRWVPAAAIVALGWLVVRAFRKCAD
jgi:hypothetical protein